MPSICPHNGHVLTRPYGPMCPLHGVPWFEECRCGARWPVIAKSYSSHPTHGTDFCADCGMPGPWLTRLQLIEWLKSNVKASPEMPTTERLELLEVLSKLATIDANDTRTATSWKRVRDAAPKLWERMKPVRDALIGEAVKKAIEALGS